MAAPNTASKIVRAIEYMSQSNSFMKVERSFGKILANKSVLIVNDFPSNTLNKQIIQFKKALTPYKDPSQKTIDQLLVSKNIDLIIGISEENYIDIKQWNEKLAITQGVLYIEKKHFENILPPNFSQAIFNNGKIINILYKETFNNWEYMFHVGAGGLLAYLIILTVIYPVLFFAGLYKKKSLNL